MARVLNISVPSQSIRRESRDWESHPIHEARAGGLSEFPIAFPRSKKTEGELRAQTVS